MTAWQPWQTHDNHDRRASFLYKFLDCMSRALVYELVSYVMQNTMQLYCMQETCTHVTKTDSSLICWLYNAALVLTKSLLLLREACYYKSICCKCKILQIYMSICISIQKYNACSKFRKYLSTVIWKTYSLKWWEVVCVTTRQQTQSQIPFTRTVTTLHSQKCSRNNGTKWQTRIKMHITYNKCTVYIIRLNQLL